MPALKVAVVGSGLAGLTSAFLVQTEAKRFGVNVEVHLFERAGSLGFHSSSLVIPPVAASSGSPSGPFASSSPGNEKAVSTSWTVDVPMRSFQGGYYPRLIELYSKTLSLAIKPAYFTYSFSHLLLPADSPPRLSTHFLYSGANGLSIPTLPKLQPLVESLARLLFYAVCYLYLLVLVCCHQWLGFPGGTVNAWKHKTGRGLWGGVIGDRWEQFVEEILIGLFGAVTTTQDQSVGGLDVGLIIGYIYHSLFTAHYTVPTNSASISNALVAPLPPSNVHLSTTITAFTRDPVTNTTSVSFLRDEKRTDPERMDGFDSIIVATQANQAHYLLESLTDTSGEQSNSDLGQVLKCLADFRYERTIVINHRDDSLLPNPRSDVRELNFVRCPLPPLTFTPPSDGKRLDYFPPTKASTYTQATHIISSPHPSEPPVYQTTNPIVPIDPATILSVAHLERALPTKASARHVHRFQCLDKETLQGHEGFWFVGAYAWEGIPLLEGCVASAQEVVLGKGGIFDRHS